MLDLVGSPEDRFSNDLAEMRLRAVISITDRSLRDGFTIVTNITIDFNVRFTASYQKCIPRTKLELNNFHFPKTNLVQARYLILY